MNRAFILFILSLFSFSIYAQNIRVESFSIVMNDATASVSPVLDANDEPCALIRLITTDNEYDIDGCLKRIEKTGELFFYIPAGTRQVTIRHKQLGLLNYSFEERLQSKATYRMVVPSNTIVIHNEDRGGHYLVMNITPANAVVHIDGMMESVTNGVLQKFLSYGNHTYRVEAPLYQMEEGSVEIGREKKQLVVALKPNFANVTLNAHDAEIRVNSESKGNGSWSGRLNPGTYLVETVKPGYRNASYTLVVVSGEDRSVDLPMPTPMYASLDVSSNAVNGSVYVDGKHIGNTPDIFKVLAGKHTVELRANGYESKSYTVEMAEGEAKKLFAELKETANCTINGHEYVDLGLPSGLKWATCNVGATKPEEYGGYYAWGETEEKSKYDWDTYKWCYDDDCDYFLTKYTVRVDNKTTLEPADDVAHVKWGGSWRMPTKDEIEELHDKCSWTWTTVNGVNGYKVIGPNGNSIFLPAAGYRSGSKLYDRGIHSYYWSGSMDDNYHDESAYVLYCDDSSHKRGYASRFDGRSVRPVTLVVYASLDVSCNAVNGSVYVDGKHIGNAPDIFKVLAGKHTVELRANGYESKSYTVEMAEGEAKKIFAELKETAKSTYGGQATIASSSSNCTINGHEYVDLGLPSGLKWATCNVGATKPEEYGACYAWGETEEKSKYDWDTYKWCNGSYSTLTKYCTDSDYGRVDNKTTLEPADDVAHVKWGGSWRMPTKDEIKELNNKCEWEWTTLNGMNGYRVTGPNGNSIFLPAAGRRSGSELRYRGDDGKYWSSSLDNGDGAYFLHFADGTYHWNQNSVSRFCGQSVRPVTLVVYASLDVSSNAVNGSVYVDGKHIGNAPDIFKVLAGKHTVELRANGYESKSYTVEMAEGEVKKLFAELKETAKSTYGGQATTASSGGNVISKPRDPNELLCIACANKNDGSIAYSK